eukprot:CAMPEP_0202899430 /NCGR_PEP_ID=MMETSP1392-20130828/7661_1 /ASSEMBLY_ACC=CAM_ASM_000868 /TAXON_ID=225041 /ORGANISM="Chlamydomonas chlamydogama, Strain SAG 11-48b" /LENGTH=109 /DNA_ID=CAMNT_0049585605 /DNA_START=50 /DNA_END=379 /DNA_ORIENTATION=+
MARAQIERWAALQPSCPRSGKLFEVPFTTYTLPRILGIMGLAGVLGYANQAIFWNQKPDTLNPEFVAEAKKIGHVAQRMNAPPVYMDPFHNRIPGSISGPEDAKSSFDS